MALLQNHIAVVTGAVVWFRRWRATAAGKLKFDSFRLVVPIFGRLTLLVSVGWRFADPLEGFLGVVRSLPTTRAEAELPGSNDWEVRAVARVVF